MYRGHIIEGGSTEDVTQRGGYRDDLHLADLVFPVAQSVAADVAAIGYTGLAYLADGVHLVDLEPQDGGPTLPPTIANVAAQRYPLARSIYVFAHRRPDNGVDPGVAEFVRFILSEEGQQAVRAEGTFLTLPLRLARRELDGWPPDHVTAATAATGPRYPPGTRVTRNPVARRSTPPKLREPLLRGLL